MTKEALPIARAAVVIVCEGRVALIKRVNDRGEYYLFPGGALEDDESPQEAAVREAHEELGLEVRITGLLAIVEYNAKEQHYYTADIVGGVFGTGTGEEFTLPPTSARGTYAPVWIELDRLQHLAVRPAELARAIEAGPSDICPVPWRIVEHR